MSILDNITGLISPKPRESVDDKIIRLRRLETDEKEKTRILEEQVAKQHEINRLRSSILETRGKQTKLYESLGTESPAIKKQKQTRQFILFGIMLIGILIIVKGCF